MIQKFRWKAERVPKFGGSYGAAFGIEFDWGSTGSTRGEPGTNHFLDITVGLWHKWSIFFMWKKL